MPEHTLMEISGSGCPQRAWALTVEGNSADISTSAITKLRIDT